MSLWPTKRQKLSKEIIELAQHVFDNLMLFGALHLQMVKSNPLASFSFPKAVNGHTL